MNAERQTTLEPLLVPANEAARLLGIGRSMFYELHSTGRLGPLSIAFGRKKLWSRLELQLWVEAKCPPRDMWLREQSGGTG